jgi:hypothetical protein
MVDVNLTVWPGEKAVRLVVAVIFTAEGAQRAGFGRVRGPALAETVVIEMKDVTANPNRVNVTTVRRPTHGTLSFRRLRDRSIPPSSKTGSRPLCVMEVP